MSDVVESGAVSDGERRRRSWSMDEKRRMIAESREPGASVAQVALRHGVNANLLFTWRRQLAAGALVCGVQARGACASDGHEGTRANSWACTAIVIRAEFGLFDAIGDESVRR